MDLSKGDIIISAIIAVVPIAIEILHKKFGGLLSGGNYSSSHTWQDMFEIMPYYLIFYVVFFVVACVYFDYMNNK